MLDNCCNEILYAQYNQLDKLLTATDTRIAVTEHFDQFL